MQRHAVGGEEEGEEEDVGKGGVDASAISPYLVVVSGTRDRVRRCLGFASVTNALCRARQRRAVQDSILR